MKVLMQIRANIFTCPGGDTVQMQKTKEYLEKLGVKVDLSLELRPNLSEYDVVHLFNLTRVQETYIQVQNAVEQNKPVVFSTIYWPNSEFEKIGGMGIRGFLGKVLSINQMESLKALIKFLLWGNHDEGTRMLITHKYQDMQRYILEHVNVYLPNAMEEMEQIAIHLGYKAEADKIIVVPNAIDTVYAKKALEQETKEFDEYADWIICVGRIDTRKNQIKLIQAIKDTDYKLLLVGKCSPGQKKYYKKVMEMIQGNPNICYIGQIPNEKMYQLYKVCRVSVLPSWFETPGLASLEAAVMGCNIVVSPKGTTQAYFGDYAFYCDVMDSASIKEQIDKAFEKQYDESFREKILNEYTWEAAAKATLKGYKKALEEPKK